MLTVLGVKQFGGSPWFRVSDRSNNVPTLFKPDINFGGDGVSFDPGETGCVCEGIRRALWGYVGAITFGRGLDRSEVNQDGPRGRYAGETGSELRYRTPTRNSE